MKWATEFAMTKMKLKQSSSACCCVKTRRQNALARMIKGNSAEERSDHRLTDRSLFLPSVDSMDERSKAGKVSPHQFSKLQVSLQKPNSM